MYRNTQNNSQDLQAICNIYNSITQRNRTPKLHRWEWFESPYENQSYVITDKDDNILGHHGILTIKFHYEGIEYIAGKTENTIMKKGYGALYFKNEQAMHKEYSPKYDILITTSAHGVTKKIRDKLGYKVFSKYVTYIQIVSIKILLKKFKNKYFMKLINLLAPFVDVLILNKKPNVDYVDKNLELSIEDLIEIEQFYILNKNNFGISQIRDTEFLSYRLLNNPYNKYSVLKLYKDFQMLGFLIYYEYENMLVIEDVLCLEKKIKQEILNRLFNCAKNNKCTGVSFKTLENTMLDSPMIGFIRKTTKDTDALFMIKFNSKNIDKKSFYFTQLMNEGIR